MKKILALLLCLLLLSGCASAGLPIDLPTDAPATAAPETTQATAATEAPAATELPVSTELPPDTEAPVVTDAPDTTTEAPQAPEPVDPWSIPDVSFFDQGYYEDDLGNGWTWSYELPCLKADTPGAREINEAIDASFGEDVREAQQAMEDKLSLVMFHIGCRWVLWEDVLSVVIIEDTDWGFTNYGVYCYDTTTGERLDTPALLRKMGISENAFLETCRQQMIQYYKDECAGIPNDQKEQYGYYDGLERQITSDFVNLELMAYPYEGGDIAIIAPIVSLAGADWYYHEIYLGIGGDG